MSRARSLVPTPKDYGPCEAYRVTTYANDTPGTDRQCTRSARYEIDGNRYCLRHAEIRSLQILMGDEDRSAQGEKQ